MIQATAAAAARIALVQDAEAFQDARDTAASINDWLASLNQRRLCARSRSLAALPEMAKSLRSKTKRAARGVKRNDEASVFHKTHEARATRLSAKLADSAQKPKRPRTPSPIAEAAMDLDAQPEAAARASSGSPRLSAC